MLGNQRYWPEWIEIADWQLSLAANISGKALPGVINSLVQKGLIEANRCRGKAKSGYKINPLNKDGSPLSNYTQNDIIKQKYNRNKTEIKQEYNRNKTEIKQKYESETPCESKADGIPKTQHNIDTTQHNIAAAASSTLNMEQWEEIVRLFEDCIHPVSNEVEKETLVDMITTDGYERVKDAIKEAAKSRAQSVKYIQAILNRWRKEGQHERRAGGSRRTHQSPDEDKRKWERESNGWRQDLAI